MVSIDPDPLQLFANYAKISAKTPRTLKCKKLSDRSENLTKKIIHTEFHDLKFYILTRCGLKSTIKKTNVIFVQFYTNLKF